MSQIISFLKVAGVFTLAFFGVFLLIAFAAGVIASVGWAYENGNLWFAVLVGCAGTGVFVSLVFHILMWVDEQ